MSLCNVWTSGDAAIIAVDTAIRSQPEGLLGHRSKILPVPHARMALACRGQMVQFGALHFALSGLSSTFDDAMERLPGILETLSANANRTPSIPGVDLTLELFVVGWSDAAKGIQVHRYLFQPGGAFEKDRSGSGVFLSPCATEEEWQAGYMIATQPDFDEQLPLFMSRQAIYGRATHPDVAFGGRILKTTLTRDFIQTIDLGEMP